MEESKNLVKEKAPMENKKRDTIIGGIVLLCIVIGVISMFRSCSGGGEEKKARERAELAVQSKIIKDSWPMESKVVYKNKSNIIVAVKYWLPGEEDAYWVTFVDCARGADMWYSMVNGDGIDYNHISKEVINDLKRRWELR